MLGKAQCDISLGTEGSAPFFCSHEACHTRFYASKVWMIHGAFLLGKEGPMPPEITTQGNINRFGHEGYGLPPEAAPTFSNAACYDFTNEIWKCIIFGRRNDKYNWKAPSCCIAKNHRVSKKGHSDGDEEKKTAEIESKKRRNGK